MAMHYQASSLTNKHDPLKFSKRLCGREQELARLAAIYHNFCRREKGGNDRTEKCPMVCISGYSGTGKSSLFQEFARNTIDKRYHVVMGKFDELQGAKAFSAVAEAFDGLCKRLMKEQPPNLSTIQASVQEAVGTESKVLKDVIPGLSILLGDSMNHQEVSTCSQENEWNRLIYVFKRFLHALCKSSFPVVLFLDDLQWSDVSSLDLIQALVTDKDLRHRLFFIGAFRSNEVNDAQHPLTSRLQIIGEWTSLEHIQVDNLSLEAINKFIADTLSLDTQDTMPLSKAVYSKTHGNIFFTMQLMESLRQQGILAKSCLNFQWAWRLEQIDAVTSISDNVVDVIMGGLSELSSTLQRVLAVAAYMRSLIHPPTLRVFLQLEGGEMTDFSLEELLNTAAEEGLLQTSGGGNFRFAHDRIKQACYGLVAEGLERNALRKRLGKYLVERGTSTSGEDWMFFVAADHLTALPTPELTDVLDQVRLNLLVGKMAFKVSALVPASRYLHQALELLETVESHWQSHYELSRSLYRSAADVELVLGHFEQGSSLCHVLLHNAKEDKDKLRAYRSLGKALGRRARHAESLKYHLKAVHLIKEFPKRFLLGHISREHSIVKKFLKKKSDFDIMMLPMNSDETKIAAMEHLLNISVRALYCSNFSVMFLADLRLLTLTFSAGICPYSPYAFAAYGKLLSAFGDQAGAMRLARLSEAVLARTNAKHLEGMVLYLNACYVDAWLTPILQTMEKLQRGYRSAMETGDIEDGYRSLSCSIAHAYAAGFPLRDLLDTTMEVTEKLEQYKVDSIRASLEVFCSVAVHLVGIATKPLDWSVVNTIPKKAKESETMRWSWFCWSYIQLVVYFREIEIAEKMIVPFAKFAAVNSSYIVTSIRVFFTGLTASALALKTGKRKHKVLAQRSTRQMKKMMNTTGINNLHRYFLLKAYVAAYKNERDVKDQFEKAILTAGRAGFTQDAALGCELAGEYFLSRNEHFWCSHYFARSYSLYSEWGAAAKADQLFECHCNYIDTRKPAVKGASRRSIPTTFKAPAIADAYIARTAMMGTKYQVKAISSWKKAATTEA